MQLNKPYRTFNNFMFLFLVTIIAIFFVSCEQSSPIVHSSLVQIVRVQKEDLSFVERLSVFVFFDDEDGIDDFGAISVSHKDTGLTWKIIPSNCAVRLRGKDRWTGSSDLAGPGEGAIPGGVYTITVNDLADNESVQTITLSRPEFPEHPPVVFSVVKNNWEITRIDSTSGFVRSYLFFFDKNSTILYSWMILDSASTHAEGTVETLRSLSREVDYVRCYTENATGTAGVLLAPVYLR